MRKSSKPDDFHIHVDSSCLTDSTDLNMPSKRNDSDQTVIHNEIEKDKQQEQEQDENAAPDGGRPTHDRHTEALIQAAARAVVASIEQNQYGAEDSVLSARTEESYEADTELTFEDQTELSFEDGQKHRDESEVDDHSRDHHYDGSASSHNEDDDVFSEDNQRSHRSSLDSTDHHNTDEEKHQKLNEIDEPVVALHADQESVSRIPSTTSHTFSLHPEPLNLTSSPRTPTKILPRQPFRSPSSVRAMQMSSPQPSIFSGSPRSSRRPTVSRLGSPESHRKSSVKVKTTPRFKFKKEYPLVLLHVTILPLNWPYADVMDTVETDFMSHEFTAIRDSWRLLQEKLGDTVFERGILLPHPQDSYEVLEERLLEALELPVRPRAKILSCGHYMGPSEEDVESSEDDSEGEEEEGMADGGEKWCDICGSEVKYKEFGIGSKQRRFKIKVYASNGLMGAGAWAAAWREMERVDVEIEPLIPSRLLREMDDLIAGHHMQPNPAEHPEVNNNEELHEDSPQRPAAAVDEERKRMKEERLREIYGEDLPERAPSMTQKRRPRKDDTLLELLVAVFKVLVRDPKNVAIGVLSVLIVVLAVLPGRISSPERSAVVEVDRAGIERHVVTAVEDGGMEVIRSQSQNDVKTAVVVETMIAGVEDEKEPVVEESKVQIVSQEMKTETSVASRPTAVTSLGEQQDNKPEKHKNDEMKKMKEKEDLREPIPPLESEAETFTEGKEQRPVDEV